MFFKKKRALNVNNAEISLYDINGDDYISLTDIVKLHDGDDHIKNWMRNRNTVEFLGLWETINNPNFKGVEFDTFRKEAGLNSFTLTPKKWVDTTNAKGIISKPGKFGGTYAHKDIAFEFCSWISAPFKLYLIQDYQRIKEIESNKYNLDWDIKRTMSKVNYSIHTDAVKEYVIPDSKQWRKDLEYAVEADFLNVALFGCTAKEWKENNPERAKNKENIRDSASINELLVLANLESYNSQMMKDGLASQDRFIRLQEMAKSQIEKLSNLDILNNIKKTHNSVYVDEIKSNKKFIK